MSVSAVATWDGHLAGITPTQSEDELRQVTAELGAPGAGEATAREDGR